MNLTDQCMNYLKRNPQVRCIKISQERFNEIRKEILIEMPLDFGNIDMFMLLNPTWQIWITPNQYIEVRRRF